MSEPPSILSPGGREPGAAGRAQAEHTIGAGEKLLHPKSVEKTGHRRNRVVMGTTAVWIGILVTHLTFSLLFGGNDLFLGAGIDSVS